MKILLTGLGSIGQRHARNLRTLLGDSLELLAYRVRRESPLIGPDMSAGDGDLESAYGIRPFDSLGEALAEKPDAVFVTNPANLHVETALAAARAGSHLLIEKPLSSSLEGVDELIAAVRERSLVCLVGYQLRFHPGFARLRASLDGIGPLLGARFSFGEYLPGWHPWEDYREGNAARADQGGGVVLAQIHDLDLALGLFGMPRSVFAVGGKRSSLDLAVEDTASILLDCDGLPVHLHQDLLRRPPVRTYEVIGEQGTALWDANAEDFDRNQLFLDELRHFLACVEGREQPVVDAAAGADSLRIALAAKRSLETGQVVAP